MSDESSKRELQKLLREFDANSGMAGFVCGRPVELMPESEQERIIKGFCTEENLAILTESARQLEVVPSAELSETEAEKISRAVPTLKDLVQVFTLYRNTMISIDELRTRVRTILHRPLPASEEGLIEAIPKLIEAVEFLAEQKIEQKDNWDRLVDCAQMHDVLTRVRAMCSAIPGSGSGALDQTAKISAESLLTLELFFKGEIQPRELDQLFQELAGKLGELWRG